MTINHSFNDNICGTGRPFARPPGRPVQNKRMTGSLHEQQASLYLKDRGFRILEQNYRCRIGEIDLIAEEDDYLVFIEVKYRKSDSFGTAAEAVGSAKQKTIMKCAQVYMKYKSIDFYHKIRFDVVAIDGSRIKLIRNAFGGI